MRKRTGKSGHFPISPFPHFLATRLGRALLLGVVLGPTGWLAVQGAKGWAVGLAGGGPVWDRAAARAFGTSLTIALLATAGAIALGVPAGWRMARARHRLVLCLLSVVPLLLPPYAVALAWVLLLNRHGSVGGWLERAAGGVPKTDQPWLAALVLASCFWPVVGWFVRTAARAGPAELEDTARLDLAPAVAARVSAGPQVRAGVAAAGLLVFLLAFADFGAANTLGIATYPREIVDRFNASYDFGEATRLAVPVLLAVLPLVALCLATLRRIAPFPGAPGHAGRSRGVRFSPLGDGTAAAAVLLGAVVPLASLATYALGEPVFARVWEEAAPALATSAVLGAVAAVVVVLVALALGPLATLPDLLVSLPYGIPGSLVAIAAIWALNRPGPAGELYGTEAPLLWVYLVLFLPFACRALAPGWRRADPDLMEEAELAGAGTWDRFRVAAWPTLAPHAGLGAGIVFLLASREMDATALLRLPGLQTVAFLIHDYLHFYPVPNVAALCLVLVALQVGAVGVALLVRFTRRD